MVAVVSTLNDKLPDRIAQMLAGQTVFITGGSGFLGKVLIEKILRRCSDVQTIYLLIRNKKGKNPQERIEDISKAMIFDVLREQNPHAWKKCKAIAGDVTEINLGISAEDRRILQNEVSFIFHCAATTRFDDTVQTATKINTRGTKFVLELANQCKNLKVFIHVSTAYSQPQETVLHETPYKPPANPLDVLKAIDFDRPDQENEEIHKKFLGRCPNTYTFTKALAEDLVVQEMDRLPALILRPSIVCPTWREPFTGWCNTLQGPMGLFVGAGKGVIRSMYVRGDCKADFIPADVVINAILVASWTYLNVNKTQRVYNVTSSSKYSKTWEEIIEIGKDVITKRVPFNGVVWYPGGSLKKSKVVHIICFYLFQIVPALFIDALLVVLGYPTVLYQIQRRIEKGSEMLEYFTTKEWEFLNDKSQGMRLQLNEKEREFYKLDGDGMDLLDYFTKCILTVRRNNLKETDDMLPAAKRNLKIMWVLDVLVKSMFIMGLLYGLYVWILAPIFKV